MALKRSPAKKNQPSAPRQERRRYPRHKPTQGTSCLVWATADAEPVRTAVHDISARGLALVAPGPVAVGAVVQVRVFNDALTFALQAKLRVVRCGALPEGGHLVAGALDRELEPSEILAFLT